MNNSAAVERIDNYYKVVGLQLTHAETYVNTNSRILQYRQTL